MKQISLPKVTPMLLDRTCKSLQIIREQSEAGTEPRKAYYNKETLKFPMTVSFQDEDMSDQESASPF